MPPILPVVEYNGERSCWAPMEFRDLVEEVPESFRPYVPSMKCCHVDEKRWPAKELMGLAENVAALIMRTEQSDTPESFRGIVEDLRQWLSGSADQELVRDLLSWYSKVVIPKSFPDIGEQDLQSINDLKGFVETKMTNFIAQAEARVEARMTNFIAQAEEKGVERGKGRRASGRAPGRAPERAGGGRPSPTRKKIWPPLRGRQNPHPRRQRRPASRLDRPRPDRRAHRGRLSRRSSAELAERRERIRRRAADGRESSAASARTVSG